MGYTIILTNLLYSVCCLLIVLDVTIGRNTDKLPSPRRDEYCEGETFQAQCGPSEVIFMTSAKYGRMSLGRCISVSDNTLGCSVNVIHKFDQWCSGRRSCEVAVSAVYDAVSVEVMKSCSREFRSYLNASYICTPVENGKPNGCQHDRNSFNEITAASGYLASIVTEENNCGSVDSPWRIKLPPGQTVQITLYDFGISTRDLSTFIGNTPSVCLVYATIKETTHSQDPSTICGSKERESVVHMSLSSALEVRITGRKDSQGNPAYFVLHYKALGCPDPKAPAMGWAKRVSDDRALIGCNQTSDSWQVYCKDTQWTGAMGHNCTAPHSGSVGAAKGQGNDILGVLNGSQWAAVVIIAAIAVTLGLIIFLVGLAYLRSRRYRRPRGSRDRQSIDFYVQQQHSSGCRLQEGTMKTMGSPDTMENDYYKTWQLQRHLPGGRPASLPTQLCHADRWTTDQRDFRRNNMVEHIYESPKFERKGDPEGGMSVQYYELDPPHMVNVDTGSGKPR